MTYRIRPGSIIVAVRRDGQAEMKTVTRDHSYPAARPNGDYFVFEIGGESAWQEFHALRKDVEVQLDVIGIADGTYTVVSGDDTLPAGDRLEAEFQEKHGMVKYVTIKLETGRHEKADDGRKNFFFGKQIVSYLSGPDNENNFTGFAHLDESGGIHVWKRFRPLYAESAINKYIQALTLLQQQGIGYQEEAGMTYALRSGRCRKCNRTLTVPASLHRGLGPVCAKGGIDA